MFVTVMYHWVAAGKDKSAALVFKLTHGHTLEQSSGVLLTNYEIIPKTPTTVLLQS